MDVYAQDLKSLFHKAYPQVQQGGEAAESIGKSVLVSQFVAGLLPALKMKVAGVDGKFDEILVKARFEEAKLRELSAASTVSTTSTPQPGKQATTAVAPGPSSVPIKGPQPSTKSFKCRVQIILPSIAGGGVDLSQGKPEELVRQLRKPPRIELEP